VVKQRVGPNEDHSLLFFTNSIHLITGVKNFGSIYCFIKSDVSMGKHCLKYASINLIAVFLRSTKRVTNLFKHSFVSSIYNFLKSTPWPKKCRVNFYVSSTPKPSVITAVHNYPPGRMAAEIDEVPGATSYKWYLDGVLNNSTATSVVFNQRFNDCGTGYYIAVEAVNSCGTSPQTFVHVAAPDCRGSYMV
jgi:hypothetical protein